VDEDVDIGGNDPPISSYPPVDIEKDATHGGSKYSSSSSSSGDSGSSSSGLFLFPFLLADPSFILIHHFIEQFSILSTAFLFCFSIFLEVNLSICNCFLSSHSHYQLF